MNNIYLHQSDALHQQYMLKGENMTTEKPKKTDVTAFTTRERLSIQADAAKRAPQNFSASARIGIAASKGSFPAISAIIRKDIKQ